MTVRPVRTTDALARAHIELNAAVERLNVVPECRLSCEFTEEVQPVGRTLDLINKCHACPVLEQCAALARQLKPAEKAHTVTAAVRYDGAGRPVDTRRVAAQAERDRRLAALGGAA